MIDLKTVSLLTGAAGLLVFAPALLAPEFARKFCVKFPRNKTAAWVLTGVGIAWSAALLHNATFFAEWPMVRRTTLILAPVIFVLVVFFLDELLAARALGGLLVLAPRPMLDAAFVSHCPWKLAIVILAYVLVICGIVLLLSPFHFRKTGEFLLKTNSRRRLTGAIGMLAAAGIIALAATVY